MKRWFDVGVNDKFDPWTIYSDKLSHDAGLEAVAWLSLHRNLQAAVVDGEDGENSVVYVRGLTDSNWKDMLEWERDQVR